MADIEDIRQRWAKATPGPWSVNLDPRNITAGPFYWKHGRPGAQWGGAEAEQATADAEAIAAARSDIAALLADRAALREQLDRLIDWHKFQANSEGGIVQQIKDTLRRVEAGASPDKRPAGWTDQSPRAEVMSERDALYRLAALQVRNPAVLDQQRAAGSAAVDVALAQQKRIADLEAELEATRAERDEYKRSKGTTYFTSDKET